MRPIPWLIRTGLFAVGFGVGLSHDKSTPPHQPVIIELQIVLPDSRERSQVSFSGQGDGMSPLHAD